MDIPTVNLIRTHRLQDFPSGSAINYHNNSFYLVGDDSTHVLVLDIDYKLLHTIHLFDHHEKRIPKNEKIDLEGSIIMNKDGVYFLIIVGSASRKNRKRIIEVPLKNLNDDLTEVRHAIHKTKDFIKRIKDKGIAEINIEGATQVADKLILANRGNRTNQENHLILTDHTFWENQDTAELQIIRLRVSAHCSGAVGLSELCYLADRDLLLVTLTSEDTGNAYDDGEIGDSYLGFITTASTKITGQEVLIEKMINLTDVDPVFKGHKIEGICVESFSSDKIMLHLISDNDQGESTLFKLILKNELTS